ncbi:hypothetical protein COB21_05470 [Candidatus Aerophobetes bacterium]|uniref:Uncharacterized protein n=1 Tax=Aerophobetes bacterium TaxID=2030807 RepID=A0A2A4WYQ4_UNCAE|nr:MAG: hypothetical protein COB21_05470 [Candidatus Aerophobetes bacterium]
MAQVSNHGAQPNRYAFNASKALKAQGINPDLFGSKVSTMTACHQAPKTARSTLFTTSMQALNTTLGGEFNALPRKQLEVIQQFIASPTHEGEQAVRTVLNANAQPGRNPDIDGIITIMKNLHPEFANWKSQTLSSAKVHHVQMHSELQAQRLDWDSPTFTRELGTCKKIMQNHVKSIINPVRASIATPSAPLCANCNNLLNLTMIQFEKEQRQEMLGLLYEKRFPVGSKNSMLYFAAKAKQGKIPAQVLKQAAHRAIEQQHAHLRANPEDHFPGTESIQKVKKALINKKRELKKLTDQYNTLNANKDHIGSLPQNRSTFDQGRFLERRIKAVKEVITTSKAETEKLEYNVQMERLSFFKDHGELFEKKIEEFEQAIAKKSKQSPSHFQHYYDCKTLIQHEVGVLAKKLGLDPREEAAKFQTSLYAEQIGQSDVVFKTQQSMSALPFVYATKKRCQQLLKELKTRKFHIGNGEYVKGLSEALDLAISFNHIQGAHGDIVSTKDRLMSHIAQMKSDEYYANAIIKHPDFDASALKKHINEKYAQDVEMLKLASTTKGSSSSRMIKRLHKQSKQLGAGKTSQETLQPEDMKTLMEMFAQGHQQALGKIKTALTLQEQNYQDVHSSSATSVTGSMSLNDLMGQNKGRIGQLDQVIQHYRATHNLMHSDPNHSSNRERTQMDPATLVEASPGHQSHFQYYGDLRIDQLARHFNPMISEEDETDATTNMIESFEQIVSGAALNERSFDYEEDNADRKTVLVNAHTKLPPTLTKLHTISSRDDVERIQLASIVFSQNPTQKQLKNFPRIQEILTQNPAFFAPFTPQFLNIKQQLNLLLTMEGDAPGRATLLRDINAHAQNLMTSILGTALQSPGGVIAQASRTLHHSVEELGYLVESMFSKDLFEAKGISPSDKQTLAAGIQTSIKKGIVNYYLASTIPGHGVQSNPVFLRSLNSHAPVTQTRPTNPALHRPFMIDLYEDTKMDTYQSAGLKVVLQKLYAGDSDREITDSFIQQQLLSSPAHKETMENCLIRYQELLSFNTQSTHNLSKHIAHIQDQHPMVRSAVNKLKDGASAAEQHALDEEYTHVILGAAKRDFAFYGSILDTNPSWTNEYDLSVTITSKLLSKLGKGKITDITMEAISQKKIAMQAQNLPTFQQDWERELQTILTTITEQAQGNKIELLHSLAPHLTNHTDTVAHVVDQFSSGPITNAILNAIDPRDEALCGQVSAIFQPGKTPVAILQELNALLDDFDGTTFIANLQAP